jgi:ABC-2 type transport system permease protein
MTATLSVLRRELGSYFNTPIGYVFMIAFLVLSSFLYVKSLFISGVADMREYFFWLPILFLVFIPGISMRLWSEERKLGTLELLLTMPIQTWQAVLGKFLAGMIFLVITMTLTFHLPLALKLLAPVKSAGPDIGPIIGGYLGTMILGMVYLSVGAFASSLTSDQIVAFIVGIFVNAALLLISIPDFVLWLRDFSPALAAEVQRFGLWHHFESIGRGVLDTRDLVYAVSMSGLFLFLNILVIERRR